MSSCTHHYSAAFELLVSFKTIKMNLDTLPNEIVTRCLSHLSTELLTDIILLENVSDNILEAAANNLDGF